MASTRAAKVATKPPRRAQPDASYEHDFYTWSYAQARALRAREVHALDWENLAEEIESLGRNNRHSVRSKMVVIVSHLLKLRYQPKKRSPSWLASITTRRTDVEALLAESPSLRRHVPALLVEAYPTARRVATFEMELSKQEQRLLPEICPFTPEQILDDEFLPE
ncbi:MAG TPA: DUF29 domain-containing protein [Candidatus Binataceae bacterium]|nr:DUF29 domain-containing protein [Candidatus Binataceae bacterium]